MRASFSDRLLHCAASPCAFDFRARSQRRSLSLPEPACRVPFMPRTRHRAALARRCAPFALASLTPFECPCEKYARSIGRIRVRLMRPHFARSLTRRSDVIADPSSVLPLLFTSLNAGFSSVRRADKIPKIDVGEWTETRFVDDVLNEIGVYGKFDPPGARSDSSV